MSRLDCYDSAGSVGATMALTEREGCGDCGVNEGQLHEDGCDQEPCAFCGGQRISCECSARHFYPELRSLFELWSEDEAAKEAGVSLDPRPKWERMGLPESVYKEGLTETQAAEWDRLELAKGRVPFVLYPNICRRCGELWPEMFRVPDAEWERYVQVSMRDKMLCRGCYDQIKGYIDGEASG